MKKDAMKIVRISNFYLKEQKKLVTLALLFALKGSNTQHFYRWLKRDYLPLPAGSAIKISLTVRNP
ncbi:MAG: hypothetical protein H0W58_02380 [Acidobacteria bacterium]|nr:hypothetical protein [Acidobacteriota bacterium]